MPDCVLSRVLGGEKRFSRHAFTDEIDLARIDHYLGGRTETHEIVHAHGISIRTGTQYTYDVKRGADGTTYAAFAFTQQTDLIENQYLVIDPHEHRPAEVIHTTVGDYEADST